MWEELSCLNNRVIFSLPPWATILERFKSRGDDFQDENSLRKLYTFFEESDWMHSLPNVYHLDNSMLTSSESAEQVTQWVKRKELVTLDELAAEALCFVSNMPYTTKASECESTLNFTFYDTVITEHDRPGEEWSCPTRTLSSCTPDVEETLLGDDEEGEYYEEITGRFLQKVRNELSGNNEYGKPQSVKSRRFVYTDNRCISFIQGRFRGDTLDFHVVLRSSNVAKTFHKDLQFVHYLASRLVDLRPEFSETREVKFRINVNSAHLVQ
jgi:hypothetical protein